MKSTTNNIFGNDDDEKDELSFIEDDIHDNPSSGKVKIYAKTDGEMYKLNSLGEESVLGGSMEKLILVESTTDIDYSEDVELFTYSDNTLNTHNFYDYTNTPNKPELRPAYEPTDAPFNVSDELELDDAIATEEKNIVITTTFIITSQKVIEHSCKISQNSGITIVSNVDIPFVIIGDNITIDGLQIINNRTSSIVSCLKFNNVEAINNTVRNCIFSTNEFAIGSDNAQIQIHNCEFLFIGTPDSHRYIQLTKTTGETLIYSNKFQSNQALSTACLLVNGSSSDYKDGSLIVYNNTSSDGTIQRMGIMEIVPESNFTLSFIENTIETFTDFWILYVGSNPLACFKEIILHKNDVSLVAGSTGFKGLIGIDSFTSGININTSTIIRASQNTLPTQFRVDYSFIPQSSASNPLMMYRPDKFNLTIQPILINPPLVSYYEPPLIEGGNVSGPSSSVDSAVVFFDGTSGKVLKQVSGVKFSGNIFTVPNLETDTTLSLNEELQKISNIDTATQSPNIVTNFNGEIHVAKIKSASHNTELEFETNGDALITTDRNINLTAGATGDIGLNTNSLTITCPDNAIRLNNQSVKFIITRIMNTFGGIQTGANINTGEYNTAFGYNSLMSINSGNSNTAIGSQALKGTNTGGKNVAVGDQALMDNTDGDNNIAMGWLALTNNTTADNNIAIGGEALYTNTTGVRNIAIGTQTLFNHLGNDNVGIGYQCLYSNIGGYSNIGIGHQSLYSNIGGYNNIGIGYQCLLNTIAGHNNTAVGWSAGGDNLGGYRNTFIGKAAGANNINGYENTFVGFESKGVSGQTFINSTAIGAYSQITATNQIVLGNNTITEIVTGSDGICNLGASNRKFNNIYGTTYHENGYSGSLIKNFPVGSNNTFSFNTTPPDLTSGDYNTFYGLYAGDNVEISNSSTCIGVNTMRNSANAVDRSDNTIVGRNAGQGTFASTFKGCTMIGNRAGEAQTTGDNNTLIGFQASTLSGNKTNAIAIGYAATVLNNNQCCIGNGSLEKIYNYGNGTCDLGAATRRFKDLHLAGNIYGLAKNSINPSNAGDKDLYNDGTLRIWLDDLSSDDIEFQITTPAGNVTTAKTYHLSSTSFKGTTTSSGAIALAGTATVNYTVDFDFQTDEVMIIRLWSPTLGTAWGFYEITCVNTYSIDFTGQPILCSVRRLL